MSLVEVIIRLCGILILLGYLYVRRRQQASSRPAERQWPGHGIVVTGISERVQRVRHDYISELNPRPNHISQRMNLLESARRVVARLPYFRRLENQRLAQTNSGMQTNTDG